MSGPSWTLDHDEHGCALCPLCAPADAEGLWADDCRHRGLYVTYELDVPVVDHSEMIYDPAGANTGIWKVRCISGHVLLTSQDFGNGDEELPPVHFVPALLTAEGRALAEVALAKAQA